MIFSEEKWAKEGLRRFVNASAGLSYDTMAPSLHQAWDMFIVPLVGDELAEHISEVYDKFADERTKAECNILLTAQNAVANLALWYNFSEINVRLTDQGHQRQESDTYKGLFKYQENDLRQAYRNKGFNAIDRLLELLAANADTFTEWADAPANRLRAKSIVRNAVEVNETVYIDRSAIIFLRLEPIMRRIEDVVLPVKFGRRFMTDLTAKMVGNVTTMGSMQVDDIRRRVGKVVINLAVADLIRETGSLTDRGLYFASVLPGKDGDTDASPASADDRAAKVMKYENDAQQYEISLLNYIESFLPDYYEGRPQDVFNRDNDGHKAFFA